MKKVSSVIIIAVVLALSFAFTAIPSNAALIGVSADLLLPDIFNNTNGDYSYDATTDLFTFTATPFTYTHTNGVTTAVTGTKSTVVKFYVNSSGNYSGSVVGNDLEIIGDIDWDGDTVIDYSGTLLTGEVYKFGWEDGGASSPDHFDFLATVTGGALASVGGFASNPIGGILTVEGSSQDSFTGSFASSFASVAPGHTKADIAPVPEPATILLMGAGLLGLGIFGRKKIKG